MAVGAKIAYIKALVGTLSVQRFTNLLKVEASLIASRMMRKPLVSGLPWSASIEPTTSCNLRCPECPTGMRSLLRPKGSMTLETFEKVLDRLSSRLMYLTLYFQGEPMLNPDFAEMAAMARKRKIFVATSTNGHYLDQTNIDKLLSSGLNYLIVSVDGMDQESYSKYRVGGQLQKVTEGIKLLVAERKRRKLHAPFIEIQFIVMRHNQHQMEPMKAFAKEVGVDRLAFKTAQVYHFDEQNTIISTLKSQSRYVQTPDGWWTMAKKIKNRCRRIWESVVVTWDGKVVPCCYDKDADYTKGDLMADPLEAIWYNERYKNFRQQVLADRKSIEICRNCGE